MNWQWSYLCTHIFCNENALSCVLHVCFILYAHITWCYGNAPVWACQSHHVWHASPVLTCWPALSFRCTQARSSPYIMIVSYMQHTHILVFLWKAGTLCNDDIKLILSQSFDSQGPTKVLENADATPNHTNCKVYQANGWRHVYLHLYTQHTLPSSSICRKFEFHTCVSQKQGGLNWFHYTLLIAPSQMTLCITLFAM